MLANLPKIYYDGKYKNIIAAEEKGLLDETDKAVLAAINLKYQE